MVDHEGKWLPDLNPKGFEVFNNYNRFLLLWGPRHSTKSVNAVNKICRHLWENDGAKVAVIGKSIRNIKSSGVWQDLTTAKYGIPHWIESGIGFDYTVPPKVTGDTKMTYFKIRNAWGTESECQIHSLMHDFEAEEKFKGTRYSMFYMPEADAFKTRLVFSIFGDQLRSDTVAEENFQILLDCNPPEEGSDHFIHDLFFKKIHPDGEAFKKEYADDFKAIHFTLDDNIWMTKQDKDRLLEKYRYDPSLYSRYARGDSWEKFSGDGHFHDFFVPSTHVFGNTDGAESDWEVLVPSKNCHRLLAGWDLGEVNHSWTLYAPEDLETTTTYPMIDECVRVNDKIGIEDFGELILEKMDFWEKAMERMYGIKNVHWTNWSDPSAFRFRSTTRADEALIIRQISEGKVILRGVPRTAGSVKRRIGVMKKLLYSNRIPISARCFAHIEMLRRLRPPGKGLTLIHPRDPLKHAFDSATYALTEEIPIDIEKRYEPTITQPRVVNVTQSADSF